MSVTLPKHYFRIRENGAAVFRVDTENKHQRIEMTFIATINMRNGEVKAQSNQTIDAEDQTAIDDWKAARGEVLARRGADEIQSTVDRLNLTAQWAQSKATEEELEAITNDLLMAMHDLRSVLVRKMSDRLKD